MFNKKESKKESKKNTFDRLNELQTTVNMIYKKVKEIDSSSSSANNSVDSKNYTPKNKEELEDIVGNFARSNNFTKSMHFEEKKNKMGYFGLYTDKVSVERLINNLEEAKDNLDAKEQEIQDLKQNNNIRAINARDLNSNLLKQSISDGNSLSKIENSLKWESGDLNYLPVFIIAEHLISIKQIASVESVSLNNLEAELLQAATFYLVKMYNANQIEVNKGNVSQEFLDKTKKNIVDILSYLNSICEHYEVIVDDFIESPYKTRYNSEKHVIQDLNHQDSGHDYKYITLPVRPQRASSLKDGKKAIIDKV